MNSIRVTALHSKAMFSSPSMRVTSDICRRKFCWLSQHFTGKRLPNVFHSSLRSFSTANTADVQEVSPSKINKFNLGFHVNPHMQKRDKGGEDAMAVTNNMIAVADGVGGWAESGVDPAIFSRRLCANIEKLALEADDV